MGLGKKSEKQVEFKIAAFPLPDQTHPCRRSPSTHMLATLQSPETSRSDSTSFEPTYKPPHAYHRPFLKHVGQLNGKTISRGGFDVKKEPHKYATLKMKCFPPPPNAAYAFTSQADSPKDTTDTKVNASTSHLARDVSNGYLDVEDNYGTGCALSGSNSLKNLDGTAHELDKATKSKDDIMKFQTFSQPSVFGQAGARESFGLSTRPKMESRKEESFKFTLSGVKTTGENWAEKIDWSRLASVEEVPGVSGYLYPGSEQHEDYIRFVDTEKPELEYCSKCKAKHIPPGAPITLEDRDTCGSYLPEWFPAKDYDKPWGEFRKMIDDMIQLTEMTQGYIHASYPEKPAWDLHFHEKSNIWKAIGRTGGWWHCRNGEDATDVEKKCDVCHKAEPEDRPVAERLADIQAFIDYYTKKVGERDKAIVLARWRAEGIP